jgi:hypothetical protein
MVDRPSAGERFTADAGPRGQIRLPPTGNLKLSVSLALSRSGCGGVILFPGGLGRLSSPAGEALRQAYLRGTDSSNSVPSSKESSNFRYRSLGTADGARRLDADAAGCAGVGTGCVRRPFGPACSSSAPKSRTPHGEDSNRASERSASRANDQRRRHQGPPRPHQTGDTRP